MKKPESPKGTRIYKEIVLDLTNELKEDFLISLSNCEDNLIKEIEEAYEYAYKLEEYYNDQIDDLNEEINELKQQLKNKE